MKVVVVVVVEEEEDDGAGGNSTPGALTWTLPSMTWQLERQVS